MTLDLDNGCNVNSGLGLRLLLHWRIRCAARHVAIDATSGPGAATLCTSVIGTLKDESNAGDLEFHLRRWRAGAAAADARGALLCLAELTSELSAEVFAEFPPPGLAVILEHLSDAAASAAMPEKPVAAVEPVTGCPGSDVLDHDLNKMVRRAAVSSADVGVAVVELDQRHRHSRPATGRPDPQNPALIGLASTLRLAASQADTVYRWGPRRFALVSWDADKVAMRQTMLQAVCLGGEKFHWGVASLSDIGSPAEQNPDLLLMMAEADLHLRRKDLSHAKAALERRRRTTLVGVAAAAMLLAAVVSNGFAGSPGQPNRVSADRHSITAPAVPSAVTPPAGNQAQAPAPSNTGFTVASASVPVAATTVALISHPSGPASTTAPPPPPPTPNAGHGPGGNGAPGLVGKTPGSMKKLLGVLHRV